MEFCHFPRQFVTDPKWLKSIIAALYWQPWDMGLITNRWREQAASNFMVGAEAGEYCPCIIEVEVVWFSKLIWGAVWVQAYILHTVEMFMLSLCRNTFSATCNTERKSTFHDFFQEDIRDFRLSKSLVLKYFFCRQYYWFVCGCLIDCQWKIAVLCRLFLPNYSSVVIASTRRRTRLTTFERWTWGRKLRSLGIRHKEVYVHA